MRRDPDAYRQPLLRAGGAGFLPRGAHRFPARRRCHHDAAPPRQRAERRETATYKEFHDGAARWTRVERIVPRLEVSAQGSDKALCRHQPRCRTGTQAENHIKAWKRDLAADRTACCGATANQFRLMPHTGAYWPLWSLRSPMPERSTWRVVQFDTLRLRLVKFATRVVALKTRVALHLPSACVEQAILRLALERLPRLAR